MDAPARASEMDVTINLVDCCHLVSTQVYDAYSMVTSCVSAHMMIDCNKSSIASMVNCTKSGNDSASTSSMIYCNKSSVARILTYRKSGTDYAGSCHKSSTARMLHCSQSNMAGMCNMSIMASMENYTLNSD